MDDDARESQGNGLARRGPPLRTLELAGTLLLVGVLSVVLVYVVRQGAGASSPAPSATGSPPSIASSESSPASTPTPLLVHYSAGVLGFDYPAEWRLIQATFDEHYVIYGPVLGTGDWKVPCKTIAPTFGGSGGMSSDASEPEHWG